MALVRASAPFACEHDGYTQVIQPGSIYEDTDPLVRANPDCFEPVRATAGVSVEQATAAPGERRDVRRPR